MEVLPQESNMDITHGQGLGHGGSEWTWRVEAWSWNVALSTSGYRSAMFYGTTSRHVQLGWSRIGPRRTMRSGQGAWPLLLGCPKPFRLKTITAHRNEGGESKIKETCSCWNQNRHGKALEMSSRSLREEQHFRSKAFPPWGGKSS